MGAIEICFSQAQEKKLSSANASAQSAASLKHSDLILDFKLDFNDHIDNKINKCNKIMGLMKKLSLTLSIKMFSNIIPILLKT